MAAGGGAPAEVASVALEELIEERQFVVLLQRYSWVFFRLANTLLARGDEGWVKKHYLQLINEADTLETSLDDYGARYNRTYVYFTELVASLRGFALAGYSIAHLEGRLNLYGAAEWQEGEFEEARGAIERTEAFLRSTILRMLHEAREEAGRLGLEITRDVFPEEGFLPVVARRQLPRNVGEAELVDEEQRIAEVATKYIQACELFGEIGIRKLDDSEERRTSLARWCTEDRARTYEATVHNLQSTYDTHIQNTVLEAQDRRLVALRGYVSAALHLLEAVTQLTHFIERHEDEIRSEEAKTRIRTLVSASEVQDVTWNELLYWANRHMQNGCAIAEELLPAYTNVQELAVDLPDSVSLHARPAALLVKVVSRYGTPVTMEINGKRANAASILELLVTAGSQSDARRLVFHGDERPLRDIRLLVENGFGEKDGLPEELGYLREG